MEEPIKTECPKCGMTIVHEFTSKEDVDEDTLCLECRGWEKNSDKRDFYIRHERKVRKEKFEDWIERRREHEHPIDIEGNLEE